jgi:hypothetical protein
MVRVPTQETNPDGKGGTYFDKDCLILAVIDAVENFEHAQTPYIEIKFRCIASDQPDQVGKERAERFNLSGKAIGRFLELACAVGCYTKPQWRADHESGTQPEIDENEFVARMFCAKIAMTAAKNPKPGKEDMRFPEIGFNIWAVGDEQSDAVPFDSETLAMFKDGLPTKEGTLRPMSERGKKRQPPAGGSPAKNPTPPNRPAPTTPPAGAANVPAGATDLYG